MSFDDGLERSESTRSAPAALAGFENFNFFTVHRQGCRSSVVNWLMGALAPIPWGPEGQFAAHFGLRIELSIIWGRTNPPRKNTRVASGASSPMAWLM
jgi:hypothetical protein